MYVNAWKQLAIFSQGVKPTSLLLLVVWGRLGRAQLRQRTRSFPPFSSGCCLRCPHIMTSIKNHLVTTNAGNFWLGGLLLTRTEQRLVPRLPTCLMRLGRRTRPRLVAVRLCRCVGVASQLPLVLLPVILKPASWLKATCSGARLASGYIHQGFESKVQ